MIISAICDNFYVGFTLFTKEVNNWISLSCNSLFYNKFNIFSMFNYFYFLYSYSVNLGVLCITRQVVDIIRIWYYLKFLLFSLLFQLINVKLLQLTHISFLVFYDDLTTLLSVRIHNIFSSLEVLSSLRLAI